MAALVAASGMSVTPALAESQAGTTLSQTVSATPHWTKTYAWNVTKSADPTSLDLTPGQSGDVTYTVGLTRDNGTEAAYIAGEVCITNGGAVATESLTSIINVTKPPSTAVVASKPLDTSGHPVLAPGESRCYGYEVAVPSPPDTGKAYKVTADTSITNHSGHLGTPFGPNTSDSFSWPSSITPVHDKVSVDDSMQGNLGTFSGSAETTYTRTFTCDDAGVQTNTATLTHTDDNTAGPSATATVTVNCTTPPPAGCTLTIGYWKNHTQAMAPKLPIWLGTPSGQSSQKVTTTNEAVAILNFNGAASNGINKLRGQLLAAKLGIAGGADGSAVSGSIADADAFLATHAPSSWNSLSKAERNDVNLLATTLDNYNNGIIGPGHCD
ncbi:hypothetical protein [Microbispora amethystogenes]|uniref:hypothetical protein n=1 Tax=Microbispora amethystogenes TaxID=1427754 RepID=UPI00195329E9|nr:hypothetical protein [Microbispora amethystogenes]